MALFRSKKDIEFVKRVNRELIERVIGEQIDYYAVSKEYTNQNFYGEARTKIVDPPVKIYCLIEWQDQQVTTNEYGQDVVYLLEIYILNDHLERIGSQPREGDFIDYNKVKFEITEITSPTLIFGKEGEDIGKRMSLRSVREGTFVINMSGTIDQALPTSPDDENAPEINFGNVKFPRSGSFYG